MSALNEITCPRCLGAVGEADTACRDCHLPLPANYCRICRENPPLPIVAIGFTNHGKTHLLAALLLTIEHLTALLPGVSSRPLGEHTRKTLRDWRLAEDRKLKLPKTRWRHQDAAADEEPPLETETAIEPSREPLIVSISGFYARRTLLIYDVAGESFETLTKAHEDLPVLRVAQTVWFVVSAFDLLFPRENSRNEGQLLGDLFASYQTAMQKLGASLEGRNAVIVLTKGDKLGAVKAASHLGHEWPANYLREDPCAPQYEGSDTFSKETYEKKLEQISAELETFNRSIPGGPNMVNLMQENGMKVHFCVAAPLGADPSMAGDTQVPDAWKRHRVLDPLIWTLRLENDRAEADSLHLVLDAAADAAPAYASYAGAPLPQALWQRLTQQREVRTWFLGQVEPAASPRQPPPPAPPSRPRPRLIGPLLESLPPKSRVVVVTHGIIPDLEDFKGTSWMERLLLVSTSDADAVVNRWDRPHTVVFRTEEDLGHIASLVQRLS
jgi:hypothetical protein